MTEHKVVCSIPTERAVLSGLAQHGQDGYLEVQDIIHVEDFINNENKIIWRCLEHAIETHKKIDIPSLMAAASSINLYEAINTESQTKYIRSIFNMPIELDNIRAHAKKLNKLTLIRESQKTHKEAYENLALLQGEESVDEILSISEAPVFNLVQKLNNERKDGPEQIAIDGQEKVQFLIDNPVEMAGIPTPWKRLNAAIGGGIRKGGVSLFAARPGVGKSTLAKETGIHVASKVKIPVLMLDTEMVLDEQFHRCLAGLSRVPIREIETGQFGKSPDDITKVKKAAEFLATIPLKFQSVAGKSFEDILSIIRRWIMQEVGVDENGNTNPCLVIYDYFKLQSASEFDNSMQEFQMLGFQIGRLTDFCKEYDFPCMSFVQINRDGITKETSDILAQSDRLLWLALSVSIFKLKDDGEMSETGKFGNMKMIPLKARFGPMLGYGDYINMKMEGDISYIQEGLTKFEASRAAIAEDSGFEVGEDKNEKKSDEKNAPW